MDAHARWHLGLQIRARRKKKALTGNALLQKRFGSAWLRAHGKLEKKLAADLKKLFKQQAESVSEKLLQLDANPVEASAVYNADDWLEPLKDVLRKHLTSAALVGAELEVSASPVKSFRGIGSRLQTLIKGAVDKVLASPIWGKVNETTGKLIEKAITAGREAAETVADTVAKIKDVLTGDAGKTRAADIARTETTLGLTTGQDAQRQEWTEDGFTDLKKTWNTEGDERVRESHADAEGQTVGITEFFMVGGEQAYGPGDVGLSAGNRCGCRCWTTTSAG